MSDSVYAVLAYIARYWFAALVIVILWRALVWLRKDADRLSRARRRLPDSGFIGEWAVVNSEAASLPEGEILRAPRDGWVGSARACDVCLHSRAVPARAARFFLRGDGLHMQPRHAGSIHVDGEPVQHEAVLRHGATLTIGDITLQLRLFAGIVLEGERLEQGPYVPGEPEDDLDGKAPDQAPDDAAWPTAAGHATNTGDYAAPDTDESADIPPGKVQAPSTQLPQPAMQLPLPPKRRR